MSANSLLKRPAAVLGAISGVAIGLVLAGGVVLAATHTRSEGDPSNESPPASVSADFAVGGQPLDRIQLSYIPKGFESSESEAERYDSGASMNSEKFTGDGSHFDIEAIRRPEPLDLGADLGFPVNVTRVSLGGDQEAFLLTASDGSGEVAVVEWQQGPTIVKVIGTNVSTEELVRIARGVSVESTEA